MPRSRRRQERHRKSSKEQLRFPVLPFDDSLHNWLEHSRLVQNTSTANMAFQAEDSSVDDNLSSVGDGAWDMIDEESTCSDNGVHDIVRQPTPLSEHPELVEYGTSSFMSHNTSSDEHEPIPSDDTGFEAAEEMQQDQLFTPTSSAFRSSGRELRARTRRDSFEELCRRENHIKLTEPEGELISRPWEQVKRFDPAADREVFEHFGIKLNDQRLAGFVNLPFAGKWINLSSAFEIFYVGPNEMRSTLVEKIGAVLTARATTDGSSTNGLDSSRVTVVPVSNFQGDASPEVVLIDSYGVDMKIEDCVSAKFISSKFDVGKGRKTVCLQLSQQKKVFNYWLPDEKKYQSSPGFRAPHIAVVYIPEAESPEDNITRKAAQTFLLRSGIPTILIMQSSEWRNVAPEWPARAYTGCPHRHIFDRKEMKLCQLPIDLETFLALDVRQLNRSIAYKLDLEAKNAEDEARAMSWKDYGHVPYWSGLKQSGESVMKSSSRTYRAHPRLSFAMLFSVFIGILAAINKSPSYAMFDSSNGFNVQNDFPQAISKNDVLSREVSLALVDIAQSAASNPDDQSVPRYQASVIGSSHVLITPNGPAGYRSKRASKTYHSTVRRHQQQIVHNTSILTGGIHILEIPIEESYGKLNISLWSNWKPRINETFEVDFGTPWLKIKAWQNAAQTLRDQPLKDLFGVQSSLSEVFKMVNTEVSRRVDYAAKKVSNSTSRSEQSMKPSAGNRASEAVSSVIREAGILQRNVYRRLYIADRTATKRLESIAKVLIEKVQKIRISDQTRLRQVESVGEAVSGLKVVELGHEIQDFRSKHFRVMEKKLLHSWWNLKALVSMEKIQEEAKK